MSEEESTPIETGKLSVTIRFGHDDEVSLKVKPTTPFSKIYTAVGKQRGVEANTFKLLVDGELLRPDATPKMMEFENDTQIDYVVNQIGGSNTP